MVLFMSCVFTVINTGIDSKFINRWMHGFIIAYPIAFIAVSIFAPITGKIVHFIVNKMQSQKT